MDGDTNFRSDINHVMSAPQAGIRDKPPAVSGLPGDLLFRHELNLGQAQVAAALRLGGRNIDGQIYAAFRSTSCEVARRHRDGVSDTSRPGEGPKQRLHVGESGSTHHLRFTRVER